MRLECRSRTAISCDSHERREQHFRRPAAKSGQVLVRTQKANTPARCGWNADRAQPFLVIATRDASSISDDRQKKGDGFGRTQSNRQLRLGRVGWGLSKGLYFWCRKSNDLCFYFADKKQEQ